jgi:plastocyanin
VRRAAAVVLAGLALAACGSGSSTDPSVKAEDFDFSKTSLTVKAGDTVEWTNTGSTEHTVRGADFFSRAIEPGGKYSHRFARAGTYRYFCTLHPDAMRATIVVTR